MKAIMVMFDSLNRHMLPPYGCDWTHAPNFRRLAERTVVFDKSYVCSMPCMPARRDLHTGRPNFLHSGWGPLEPFDDSMPAILRENGIHTHLATDHYHYLEDGGATYHHRYSSWEAFRGQEGDQWVGYAGKVEHPPAIGRNGATDGHATQEWVNRMVIKTEEQYPQTQTFAAGLEYIRRNHKFDNWFLQIETFDPHEPFRSPDKYHELYDDPYDGPIFDWPKYGRVTESPEEVHHMRMNYASLLSMCDNYLGKILDEMDRLDLWKDTMLIVWTDHGFMLGEKGWWAKGHPPMYEEVAHTPFFIWDPRCGKRNERRSALVQPSIDLAPTLLDFFGLQPTPRMHGKVLRDTIASDKPVRDYALFGYHGSKINITDGRYVYFRDWMTENNGPVFRYTLMPTVMRGFVDVASLAEAELAGPFSFTKNCRLLKFGKAAAGAKKTDPEHMLFDIEKDPNQETRLSDPAVENRLIAAMKDLMKTYEAPPEQYVRMGLE